MKASVSLNGEDRDFFTLVTEAILTNPFLEERAEVLAQTVPGLIPDRKRPELRLLAILPVLNDRIGQLERKGLSRIKHFHKEDRQLLRDSFLLQVYLQFLHKFDELIQDQLSLGETPAEVRFAQHVIAQLKARGFLDHECLRYLALFYQLRRAYYFISQALVGDSPSMRMLRLSLWNSVFTSDVRTYDQHLWNRMEDFSTILLGETGTGKGSAAAAIGRSGFIPFDRKKGRFTENFTETFIAINLSQYPESLIESELFGHRKGAFTGAVDHHKGLFERCSAHGSLFLDEIGDISIPVQIKLLQVLQERDDFFYRLCSDVITVPTLRQRIEESPSELEQMVNLLVTRMTDQVSPKLTDMILTTLQKDLPPEYTWPGNVRELEQAVRRILLTGHYYGDVMVTTSNLEEEFIQNIQTGNLRAKELLSCEEVSARYKVGACVSVELVRGGLYGREAKWILHPLIHTLPIKNLNTQCGT
jgi:hypothetical protein